MNFLIGHLIGDYLLQTHAMGMKKKNKGLEGFMMCFLHCLLYALAVEATTGWNIRFLPLVFLSHWIVDRYRWFQWIHSRVYKRPTVCSGNALGIITYVAGDNTIHLSLLWLIEKLI